MSTPPLVDLPESTCAANVIMSLTRAVAVTESPFTNEQQAFKWPGEYWQIEFRVPPTTSRDVAAEWKAFGAALEGQYGYFLCGDFSAKTPRGVATGTPLVDGGAQTGNTLTTKGWTPNITGILKKGDYFQLGTATGARLHMLIEDADTDGSGDSILTFVPALRSSPNDEDPLVIQEAKGLFRLMDNTFAWSVDPGNIHRFSFSAREVIVA